MLHPSFDIAAFLRDSWQKRPLLIKNPWADWQNPLAPDELAGLACEADVESRLIARNGGRANGRLVCEHGPIDATRFGRLGKKHWTLLVQAVDHHVPAVAALIEPFRFVPNWRIDDVMVSYAVDGGGVGAHFDQYDVFLIQGLGIRRWRVGQACDASTALLPHDDLRLLADFTPTAEYWLEPGDMLYLPPGIAHDGVAVGDDCMTYSIGFRAPACSELISDWADHVASQLPQDDRYTDPGLRLQDNPGEIAPDAIAALHESGYRKIAGTRRFCPLVRRVRHHAEIRRNRLAAGCAARISGFAPAAGQRRAPPQSRQPLFLHPARQRCGLAVRRWRMFRLPRCQRRFRDPDLRQLCAGRRCASPVLRRGARGDHATL